MAGKVGGRGIPAFWRFISNLCVDHATGCWNWTAGRRGRKGLKYGQFREKGSRVGAHRFAFALRSEIPEGLLVLHRCDNSLCCNPDHLFLGTNMDNKKDSMAKSRHAVRERNGRARLTSENAREIRVLCKSMSTAAIARKFDVGRSTVRQILEGRSWKTVT